MAFENVTFYDVDSSNISQIGFDENEMVLYIVFTNNTTYWYSNVDLGTWQGLLNAESVGKYFWGNIRNAGYEYGKM